MMRNMPILPVSKNTFLRVARGEQTEIYRTYGEFWLKKLYYQTTFQPRKYDYITITSGTCGERKVLRVKLKAIGTKEKGNPGWEPPKGKVFVLYIDKIEKNDY